jgi:hypothetical protein
MHDLAFCRGSGCEPADEQVSAQPADRGHPALTPEAGLPRLMASSVDAARLDLGEIHRLSIYCVG